MSTSVNPTCNHMSASSIGALKACPQRYRLAYREGIRSDRDTDSQRCGTNWHALHETYANAIDEYHRTYMDADRDALGPEVPTREEWAMKAVISLLNDRYTNIPSWVDAEAWAVERQVLLTSFQAYLWYWQNDPIEFLASEIPFNLPLHEPRTGMPLSMKLVQRVGKIDHIVKWNDAICSLERKSTSRSIAPDSDYWDKSKKDTQVSMYALAMRDLRESGQLATLKPLPLKEGEMMPRYGNTLYDVWKKPTIKPAMLTQKETQEFLDTGSYCGQPFGAIWLNRGVEGEEARITVNDAAVKVEMGKKGFAIRETPEMFGARLLQDMYERPSHYFVRREIARTQEELRDFRRELFAIYQAQSMFSRTGCWFSNESQCRATFACSYINICYGLGADAVCDGKTTPAGFKRIFVDLTRNGQPLEEE